MREKLLIFGILLAGLLQGQIQPDISAASKRSSKKAMLLSAIFPGAGQISNKNYLAAGVYAGLEVTLIASSIHASRQGNDGVKAYEAFADAHWDVRRWFEGNPDPAIDNPGYYDDLLGNPKTHNVFILVEGHRYTFDAFVARFDTREELTAVEYEIVEEYHFYENIGKYKQFKQGWDDFDESSGYEDGRRSSPNQEKYAFMRRDANDYLKRAGYLGTAIMFNHLISAVDAFIRTNRSGAASTLEARTLPLLEKGNSGAIINLTIKL